MTTFNVGTEAELRDAIFQISNDFALDGVVTDSHVINIIGNITLTQSLPMIRGDGTHTITINGGDFTIDANNAGRGFFVESGNVTINDVTIANAVSQGGNGGDGAATVGNPAFSGTGGGGGLGASAACSSTLELSSPFRMSRWRTLLLPVAPVAMADRSFPAVAVAVAASRATAARARAQLTAAVGKAGAQHRTARMVSGSMEVTKAVSRVVTVATKARTVLPGRRSVAGVAPAQPLLLRVVTVVPAGTVVVVVAAAATTPWPRAVMAGLAAGVAVPSGAPPASEVRSGAAAPTRASGPTGAMAVLAAVAQARLGVSRRRTSLVEQGALAPEAVAAA